MQFTGFQNSVLSEHNSQRASHGAPPLALDRQLTTSAQNWAGELARRRAIPAANSEAGMRLYQGQATGENIFVFGSSDKKNIDGRQGISSGPGVCIQWWQDKIVASGTLGQEWNCGFLTVTVFKVQCYHNLNWKSYNKEQHCVCYSYTSWKNYHFQFIVFRNATSSGMGTMVPMPS